MKYIVPIIEQRVTANETQIQQVPLHRYNSSLQIIIQMEMSYPIEPFSPEHLVCCRLTARGHAPAALTTKKETFFNPSDVRIKTSQDFCKGAGTILVSVPGADVTFHCILANSCWVEHFLSCASWNPSGPVGFPARLPWRTWRLTVGQTKDTSVSGSCHTPGIITTAQGTCPDLLEASA